MGTVVGNHGCGGSLEPQATSRVILRTAAHPGVHVHRYRAPERVDLPARRHCTDNLHQRRRGGPCKARVLTRAARNPVAGKGPAMTQLSGLQVAEVAWYGGF